LVSIIWQEDAVCLLTQPDAWCGRPDSQLTLPVLPLLLLLLRLLLVVAIAGTAGLLCPATLTVAVWTRVMEVYTLGLWMFRLPLCLHATTAAS
jgi:hypothetical protein